MSEAVRVSIIVSIPPTLAVLLTWWLARRERAAENKRTNVKLTVIQKDVNSRLTKALAEISKLQGEVRGLRNAPKGKLKK